MYLPKESLLHDEEGEIVENTNNYKIILDDLFFRKFLDRLNVYIDSYLDRIMHEPNRSNGDRAK